MGVSTSIGPVSGIDYGTLINGLTAPDAAAINAVNTQVQTLGSQDNALLSISALITQLRTSASAFESSAIFRAATATVSNPSVLTATAGTGTPTGTYSFTVQRVASSSQLITQGFNNTSTALGTAGNLTFSFGDQSVDQAENLGQLNGGSGVAAGSIRITDSNGASSVIDLSNAVDINDVVNTINSNTSVDVTASIQGDHLVVADKAGGAGTLTISNVGNTTTASDLGLTQAAAGGAITGTDINELGSATSLSDLNDGLGVRTAGVLNDFAINTASNGALNVSLNGATTLGDVVNKINAAGLVGGTQVVTAAISADGHGITLTQAGGGALSITALNGSDAAADLGLTGSTTTGTLTGDRINGGLNSALLKDLNGSTGVDLGDINITNRAGTVTNVDLSGAQTVNDVLNDINNANAGVTAALNSSGTGIVLNDTTGATTGSISVADGATGHAATDLGLAQTVTGSSLSGSNLNLRIISDGTLLSTLNGGNGISAGKIQLTDSTGASSTIDLSSGTLTTVGQVIAAINANPTGIRASYDPNGNGIQLTDSTSGTGVASVTEVSGGTTAASLGIKGTFTDGTLDGTFNQTVAVAATDTLQDIANNINAAGGDVQASIINDGSANGYRLSLTSRNSGAAGNINFDGSSIGLTTTQLVQGQDAVVLYGSGVAGTGLEVTSSTNTLTNLVPNLTVNLVSASSSPVTVSVAQDTSAVPTAIQTFVTNYNAVVQNIGTVTAYNATNSTQNGVLFENSTVESVQDGLSAFITQQFPGVGSITNLSQLGISVNEDGTLALDTDTLNAVLSTDPSDVQSFFSSLQTTNSVNGVNSPVGTKGFGQQLSDLITKYTDASTGTIFDASNALETQENSLNDQVNNLNVLLADKRQMYVTEFANLETTIAGLQSQGNALSSLSTSSSSSSSSSSTKSSS